MRYGIDATTLLHVLDHDLPLDPSHQLVAPSTIRSEALGILLADVRAGRRTEDDALALHERITELKMRVLGDRVSRGTAWRLAREHDWPDLHDAEYLAVTRLQADALITVDPRLAKRVDDIVALAPVEALGQVSR